MQRIREILLSQYIGAITIGFLFAQATVQFINELATGAATYWALHQVRESALTPPRPFPWSSFNATMGSVVLQVLVGFVLLRWLYMEDKAANGEQHESAEAEPQP